MQISKQFSLFLAVGLLNTGVGFLLYSLFIFTGLHYSIAVFLSTCLGVGFNFFSTGKLVFANTNKDRLIYFIFTYSLTYCLNIASIKGFLSLGFDQYWAYLFSIPFISMISFSLLKWFVYSTDK